MGYESYFRDPQLKKQADKIILEFKRIKGTLIKINEGLQRDISIIEKLINNVKQNPTEEVINDGKKKLFDFKIDLYALIEKGEAIVFEMKTRYFNKSPKLEFKNRELLEEHKKLVDLSKKKLKELEEVLKNGGQPLGENEGEGAKPEST